MVNEVAVAEARYSGVCKEVVVWVWNVGGVKYRGGRDCE